MEQVFEIFEEKQLTAFEVLKAGRRVDNFLQEKATPADALAALKKSLNRLEPGEYDIKLMRHNADHKHAIHRTHDNRKQPAPTATAPPPPNETEMTQEAIQAIIAQAKAEAKIEIRLEAMEKKVDKILDLVMLIASNMEPQETTSDEKSPGVIAKTVEAVGQFSTLRDSFKTAFKPAS